MESTPSKRKANFSDGNSRKVPKMSSFALRMMEKMGHKEGEGLGRSGDGMLNPIEVKLRPQGAGLGAVREKTEQAKEEARRQAERRGEEFEDSSEEERKAQKRRNRQTASSGSGTSTPRSFAKPRVRYLTAADIVKAAEGLEVPNVFESIIDATGDQRRLLTSAAGFMTSTATGVEDTETEKLTKRARRELEGFAGAWNELTERKNLINLQENQAIQEMQGDIDKVVRMRDVVNAVESLTRLSLVNLESNEANQWESITTKLEHLQSIYMEDLNDDALAEVAVAAISPLFKKGIADWAPLDEPTRFVSYIERLKLVLCINAPENIDKQTESKRRRSTTPYESLVYMLWLPKVRSAITNDWDPYAPQVLISLIEAWKPLLPEFIVYSLINIQVFQKLSSTLQTWNPRTALISRKRLGSIPLPYTWLFPWLPHLSPYHVDANSATGLLSDVKRKLRLALDTWDLTQGVLPGLAVWAPLFGQALQHTLVRHVLPRLAAHLASEFEVYPPDQKLTPLEQVLEWNGLFPARTMAQLLVAEFFPKWLNTLHAWLTSDSPNYEEIGAWFTWWKAQIPIRINEIEVVAETWDKGLSMMNMALDLGEHSKSDLPLPAAGPARPILGAALGESPAPGTTAVTLNKPIRRVEEEPTFKDVVEAWCEEESMLLLPLREAHHSTGLPLFRITASATGKGGVVVYFKGDVIWAQKREEKAVWEPVGLEERLVLRAEGR
jgi:tuftelin-interacting protein 11